MKIKLLPGYPTYEFKLNWYDALLLTEFVVCCLIVVLVTGDMISHAGGY